MANFLFLEDLNSYYVVCRTLFTVLNILMVGTSFRDWHAALKLWFLNQQAGMCFDTFDHVSTSITTLPAFLFPYCVFVAGIISATTHNCTIQELEQCFQALNAITQTEELALAATKEELIIVCRRLQNGFRCIEDHSLRCFTAVQRRIFQSVVSESRHVIEDLCVPGELQEDYLLYAPCWKNVSTDERKCALQYKRLAHSTDPEKDVNDNLKLHCCLFTEFVKCQHEHLLKDCGSEAEQFYQTHMDRMSGSLINEHCILYTHDSSACAFNNSSSHTFDSHHLLYILTLYMISSHVLTCFKKI